MQTKQLTPQEQAERERLERVLAELNSQIETITAKMQQELETAIMAATQKSFRPALRRITRRD
jgi:hypothetical protein